MGKNSNIEWCHHTFNHIRGCTKVSAGCANCYAETLSHRNPGTLGVWGPKGTRVVAAESAWREPLKWDRAAAAAGERHRVFCASLADVFEDWLGAMVDSTGERFCVYKPTGGLLKTAPYAEEPGANCRWLTMDDVRRRLFALIDATPNLDWLLLTKRPENILDLTLRCQSEWWYRSLLTMPANVWLGTSVENQDAANERIPHLLRVPAAVRFLSAEPLLDSLRLDAIHGQKADGSPYTIVDCSPPLTFNALFRGLHWVICGGESGPNARPMHPAWARSLRDQCQAAGVPFFFKQWGEFIHAHPNELTLSDGRLVEPWPNIILQRVGKKAAGRLLDGRVWDEFPAIGGQS